ncbi:MULTISPECIES: hypothetical protein [Mycolicibacterium]|uniref:Transmembrane protein n=3 Tax=Mycolicibacterium gilvum TaxID=1804 RepID=E6TFI9_MYCSR|nr:MULTISPECIES: hypothetical protein [Mycolicibacterium]ABP46480.1 conserved hypothetical protein [Mycolicibacterium gilvum PYR-GCK]ADT99965.1 hypothetical protein Mspyr1_33540 [Mycolicibacterium gilvum Spyr1]MBV5244602.1 hypothetical protein [Mycolicibacterium sp. PAM1]MCV7059102.1 hypothetical protein [Mycolicibacterium gilvum]STZ43026.1 Conserved membrane protein of uncharacterised function [Mycolicibacterium gilvum]
MPGMAEFALAGAPIAGGALLGLAAGNLRPPDVRDAIAKDLDLLERLPAEQVERRAELQRIIDMRIDGLVAAADKSRELRELAMSYEGNWRDIVLFVCAIMFTLVWWHVDHSRSNWLVMFVVMIVLTVIVGIYAARGVLRGLASFLANRRRGRQ